MKYSKIKENLHVTENIILSYNSYNSCNSFHLCEIYISLLKMSYHFDDTCFIIFLMKSRKDSLLCVIIHYNIYYHVIYYYEVTIIYYSLHLENFTCGIFLSRNAYKMTITHIIYLLISNKISKMSKFF